jgi:mannose-6-phosphate isomerase
VNLAPLRIEPRFVPRIWGTRSLEPLFPERRNLAEPVGEVWLTGDDCLIAEGPFAGRSVGDVWGAMTVDWTGTRVHSEAFPLLVKFLFPREILSIQVHPDDPYAAEHESARGGRGKTEMWYALEAQPGAEVLVGLRAGVTRDAFLRAIAVGKIEELLERIPVRTGDAIFVPAGTVHTIGPGMVLCEIQENSDITYRLFDYNRLTPEGKPRDLHIERALDVIQFGEQSGGRHEPIVIDRGSVRETYFIACRHFATEKWEFAQRIAAVTSPEHFELLIVLEGSGQIRWGGASVNFERAQAWMLPAALGAYQLSPEGPVTLLRTYVPDIVNDFVRRLADQRVEESAWSRLVYP